METKPKENRKRNLNIKDLLGLTDLIQIWKVLLHENVNPSSLSEIQQVNPKAIPHPKCILGLFHQPLLYLLWALPETHKRAICTWPVVAARVGARDVLDRTRHWSHTDVGLRLSAGVVAPGRIWSPGVLVQKGSSTVYCVSWKALSLCLKDEKTKSASSTRALSSALLIAHLQIWDLFPVNKHRLLRAVAKASCPKSFRVTRIPTYVSTAQKLRRKFILSDMGRTKGRY